VRRAHPQAAAIISTLGCAVLGLLAGPASARSSSARPARGACPAHRASAKVIGRSARSCSESSRPAHHRPPAKPAPQRPRPIIAPAAGATATAVAGPPATIAAVLATPCQNTEATPEAGNVPLLRAAVLCLVNRVRAERGESPLASNPDLERVAEEHSQELVADDYFAHVSPSGVTPVDRIRATGYIPGPSFGYVIGENLAWGTLRLATPEAIVQAWVASPGHLANILEARYKDTGIGVATAVPPSLSGGQPGATYAQEFGVILG